MTPPRGSSPDERELIRREITRLQALPDEALLRLDAERSRRIETVAGRRYVVSSWCAPHGIFVQVRVRPEGARFGFYALGGYYRLGDGTDQLYGVDGEDEPCWPLGSRRWPVLQRFSRSP